MSDLEKNKKTNDAKENEIGDIQYKKNDNKNENREKKKTDPEHLDDLEFISEETVKDKSKMAGGDLRPNEFVPRKKTRRRSLDSYEAKKEKSIGFFKSHLPLIGIGCLIIVVALCAIIIGVKNHLSKKEAENKAQPVSEQQYEKDEHQDINDLVAAYYETYAAGDTETIQQYAYPMTEKEKSYISVYSKYIERFENLTCYTKSGADEKSFIVSVAMEIKFKGVDTTAPGLDFFYVRTADDGSVYIDNTYSQFNLVYKENPLDENIQKLIENYEAGEDVKALLAGVDLRYGEALEKDAALKKMIDETVTGAIVSWKSEQETQQQQKEQEAQKKLEQEKNANKKKVTEKSKKDWVYATENVIVRKKPKVKSKALASATKGSELRRLAVTSNGWSKVKTGSIVGYVKSEYISGKKPKKEASAPLTFDEGKQIYLENTINVRKSMSEKAERVGVAYAGETVTVVMSYDEGWTKVNWNGKTGYVKTEVLAGN